jgi:GNAT superfamily N-acetyltransferase
VTTLIKQYPLDSGALEIQFIEEHFGEFGRRKTAADILARLADRPSLILMIEAPMPDDPGSLVPVAYKVVHELRADEREPKLRDLVDRVGDAVDFAEQRVVYSWIGGTRRDWRGQGHFRALSEEAELWASALGCGVMLAKTKNRFHDMRAALAQLHFDVIKFEINAADNTHSKLYYAKRLEAGLVRDQRASRTVVVMD